MSATQLYYFLYLSIIVLQKNITKQGRITCLDHQHIGMIHSKETVGPFHDPFYNLVAKIHSLKYFQYLTSLNTSISFQKDFF